MSVSLHRPPKMARLIGPEKAPGKYLKDLPLPFKERVAGYLIFHDAFYFAGPKLSFYAWLRARGGIDDTDGWSSRTRIGDKWDRLVFPKILRRIEENAHLSWFKTLSLAQVTHGQLAKFSSLKLPHLQTLHLNFSSRELHKPSIVLERAVAAFGKNCPRLTHVAISIINERECLLLLEHGKGLVSLKISTIDYLPDPKKPEALCRWNWQNIAEKMAKMPALKAVYLHNKIVDREVEHVTKIPQLRSLFFWDDPKISDETLQPLASCQLLEEVGLRNLPKVTSKTAERVLRLPQLTALNIENCESMLGTSLRPNEVSNLKRLVLTTSGYADQILKFVPHSPSLASVKLANCKGLSDQGFTLLGKCQELRDLEVSGGNQSISDKGLLSLTQSPLRFLRLKIDASDPNQREAEQAAWKNVTIIGVRKFVEQSPQLRLFETPLPRVVISFTHTDNELLQEAILRSRHRLEVAFLNR